MRYASEDLMNEHEGILFGLTILEKMANMVRGDKRKLKAVISEKWLTLS
jgi:hypothetical protein